MILRTGLFLIVTLLQACATSTDLKPSGEININQSNDVVIEFINKQAMRCWAKEFSFNQDAIRVVNRGYMLFVNRWAPDLGSDAVAPFFQLRVMGNDTESTVIMSEGELGLFLPMRSFSDDVKRWLSGDLACKVRVE